MAEDKELGYVERWSQPVQLILSAIMGNFKSDDNWRKGRFSNCLSATISVVWQRL